jgi:hypothetical protein
VVVANEDDALEAVVAVLRCLEEQSGAICQAALTLAELVGTNCQTTLIKEGLAGIDVEQRL